MEIDPEQVRPVIEGEWDLVVEIPKHHKDRKFKFKRTVIKIGKILEIDRDKMIERDSLLAETRKRGKFLCQISLDSFTETEEGFMAEGIGYQEDDDRKAKGEKLTKGGNYFGGSAATQYWQAV